MHLYKFRVALVPWLVRLPALSSGHVFEFSFRLIQLTPSNRIEAVILRYLLITGSKQLQLRQPRYTVLVRQETEIQDLIVDLIPIKMGSF